MANERILIVEDELVVAEQLQRTLASRGYDVVGIASSGEEAIRQAGQSRPALVVMDILLPGKVDGVSAAQALKPLGIPVVFLSAYADRHLLDRAQHTEPLGYLMKPATSSELGAVIQLALFKREQEQMRDRAGHTQAAANREAAEQFRLMVAGVTEVAIFTLDIKGKVNSWNAGAERVCGYSTTEIIGQAHAILFTPEDRAQGIPRTELELAEQNGSADNTRWLVRQTGERYWAEGVLAAIRDDSGTLTGFTKIARDATVQKRAQDALRKSEQKLQIALRAARMGTWEWDIKKNHDTLDANLRELFGLGPDQDVQTIENFYALIHPDDRDTVVAAFERTRHEGVHLDTEFRVNLPDGTQRWLLDQGEVLCDAQGNPELMTGACVDITARKQAEEALKQSEERFQLFVNGVRDYALFQMNEQGRIVSWNAGAERLLGYSQAEILGQPASLTFVPEDIAGDEPQREIGEALRLGRSEDERWYIRKDGARFWCSGVLTRIDDAHGRLRGFAKVMHDETERRQTSEKLASSLSEKEALLMEIHHRVKNNLQVITSLLTLQSGSVEDGAARTMFDEAVNRVRTIAEIHELLYRSPELARVDFNVYLTRLAQHLLSFYGVDPDRVRVPVSGNGVKLELSKAIPCGLIVNELLTNSLKHAFPDGRSGEVRVSLHSDNGLYILEVSDHGIGLPDDASVEDTTSLGLRLVSLLAKQLDGEFKFDRKQGTHFVVSFAISGPDKRGAAIMNASIPMTRTSMSWRNAHPDNRVNTTGLPGTAAH